MNSARFASFLAYYTAAALISIFAALVFGIHFSKILPGPPLRGPLIAWTHILTLGALLPVFMGLSLTRFISSFNLQNIFNARGKYLKIHFVLYFAALPVYIYLVYFREGGPLLTAAAAVLFISVCIYLWVYISLLMSIPKSGRNGLYWLEWAMLFYLFQAVSFGLALVSNLQYGWFFSQISHSVKVHAHSGFAGYFLPAVLLWMLRYNNLKNGQWLGHASWAAILSTFLWTSVHDKSPAVFNVVIGGYVFSAGAALFVVAQNLKLLKSLVIPFFFLAAGALMGVDIVTSNAPYIHVHNIPLQYGAAVIIGFFIPMALSLAEYALKNGANIKLGAAWHFLFALCSAALLLGFYFNLFGVISGALVGIGGLTVFAAVTLKPFLK